MSSAESQLPEMASKTLHLLLQFMFRVSYRYPNTSPTEGGVSVSVSKGIFSPMISKALVFRFMPPVYLIAHRAVHFLSNEIERVHTCSF